MVEVIEYVTESGASPYSEWFLTLNPVTQARVATYVLRMAEGNDSAVKSVGAGVYEIRMHFGPGYRVYFGREGDRLVILLGGGTKHRQQKDIERAQALWEIHKSNKK